MGNQVRSSYDDLRQWGMHPGRLCKCQNVWSLSQKCQQCHVINIDLSSNMYAFTPLLQIPHEHPVW